MLPQLALPQIEALQLLVESAQFFRGWMSKLNLNKLLFYGAPDGRLLPGVKWNQ